MRKLFVMALLLLSGCAAHKPQETGFLSTYKNLQPVSSTFLRYLGPSDVLNQYNAFIIDPVTVKFYDASNSSSVTPENVEHLREYLFNAVNKELSSEYKIVTQPGPGVARLRIAITNLTPSTPALNVLPQTKLLGLGLGEASVEAELVDSQTGVQLAAVVESDQGSRFSFAGLSDWGDVEAIMNDWAHRLQIRINQIHKQAKTGAQN